MTNNDHHRPRICPADRAPCPELHLLAADYPAFDVSRQHYGRHGLCWVAIRKDRTAPGLHTAITSDLAELNATLVLDAVLTASQRPESRNAALRSALL